MPTTRKKYCTLLTHIVISPIVWMPRSSLEGITLGATTQVVTKMRFAKITLDVDPSVIGHHIIFIGSLRLITLSHNVFIKPIVTMSHGMYSHVRGTLPISFVLIRLMVVDTHVIIPIVMTIGSPTT
jgi:hypothetical protein